MIAKNHGLLTVLVSFERCGPGWFWVVYLYWSFTAKAVFINSAGTWRISSVWSSLQRYNEKGAVNIPVQSQSHHADHGLPSGYIQLYHVSHVQTQHRFASNCFYNNLFPFLTIMFRGGCTSLRKILLQVQFSRKSKFLRTFFYENRARLYSQICFSKTQTLNSLFWSLHQKASSLVWNKVLFMKCYAEWIALPFTANDKLVRYSVTWHGIAGYDMTWRDMTWHDMPVHITSCHGMPYHAMPRHDMAWYSSFHLFRVILKSRDTNGYIGGHRSVHNIWNTTSFSIRGRNQMWDTSTATSTWIVAQVNRIVWHRLISCCTAMLNNIMCGCKLKESSELFILKAIWIEVCL